MRPPGKILPAWRMTLQATGSGGRLIMRGLFPDRDRYMSDAKTVNGYAIKKLADNQWWVCGIGDEAVAGPFPTESLAIEVASVFEDTPAPRRRSDAKN